MGSEGVVTVVGGSGNWICLFGIRSISWFVGGGDGYVDV